ncbi:hypothetical protein BJV74DRAFT_254173 [Russula compacta]|nr:hypothetical protein BJV74DRAFT_254173 [Russula compacta]
MVAHFLLRMMDYRTPFFFLFYFCISLSPSIAPPLFFHWCFASGKALTGLASVMQSLPSVQRSSDPCGRAAGSALHFVRPVMVDHYRPTILRYPRTTKGVKKAITPDRFDEMCLSSVPDRSTRLHTKATPSLGIASTPCICAPTHRHSRFSRFRRNAFMTSSYFLPQSTPAPPQPLRRHSVH